MNETITLRDLAKMIDHSLLHPTMTDGDIRKGCELARKYDVDVGTKTQFWSGMVTLA